MKPTPPSDDELAGIAIWGCVMPTVILLICFLATIIALTIKAFQWLF